MGSVAAIVAESTARPKGAPRRSLVPRRRHLPCEDRNPVARPAGALRQVEERLQPVSKLVAEGLLGADLPRAPDRHRRDGVYRRWLRGPRSPRCVGRKRGIQQNALGRSRGGFSTKIHAIVDAKGRPLHVTLTPGERHEMVAARELLDHAHGAAFVADTGYEARAASSSATRNASAPSALGTTRQGPATSHCFTSHASGSGSRSARIHAAERGAAREGPATESEARRATRRRAACQSTRPRPRSGHREAARDRAKQRTADGSAVGRAGPGRPSRGSRARRPRPRRAIASIRDSP